MDWVTLAQQMVNGLTNGVTYAFVAIGVTLIFGVLRIINFAHGEFYMLGAYVTYYLVELFSEAYYGLAVVLATVAIAMFGMLVNRLVFWPQRNRHESVIILSSLGLSVLLASGTELLAGADPKYIGSPIGEEVFELGGGLIIAQQRALILVVAAIVIGAVYLFIRRTAMGKMMQATAQNPVGAALSGIDIRWVHSYTFGIACGLAALGGGLVGPTSSLSPSIGIWAVIKGFIVVIMGGMGNVPGALAAGIFLGVAESLGAGYVSAGFGQAIGYTLVVLIILLRPASLFAKGR